jgi:hypothetical protein
LRISNHKIAELEYDIRFGVLAAGTISNRRESQADKTAVQKMPTLFESKPSKVIAMVNKVQTAFVGTIDSLTGSNQARSETPEASIRNQKERSGHPAAPDHSDEISAPDRGLVCTT